MHDGTQLRDDAYPIVWGGGGGKSIGRAPHSEFSRFFLEKKVEKVAFYFSLKNRLLWFKTKRSTLTDRHRAKSFSFQRFPEFVHFKFTLNLQKM